MNAQTHLRGSRVVFFDANTGDFTMPQLANPVHPVSMESLIEALQAFPLFSSLDLQTLKQLERTMSLQHCTKDETIFYEQDTPSENGGRIYFLIAGCVKLIKYSSEGESTIVRLVAAGEFFGVTGALNKKPYPFSAEASTDTVLVSMTRADFLQMIEQSPKIAVEIICSLGELLWFNYATHNQVVKKSETRVAKIILYHYQREGAKSVDEGLEINIRLPHEYVASMTGIAYEESVRIISRLRKQHQCIQYLRGGRMIITDLPKLETLAQECCGHGNTLH